VAQHSQILVTYPLGKRPRTILVDVGIYPLLRQIWALGFETTGSCEDNGGRYRIWFKSRRHQQDFLALIPGATDEGGVCCDFPKGTEL
jgi:hypothetical protein